MVDSGDTNGLDFMSVYIYYIGMKNKKFYRFFIPIVLIPLLFPVNCRKKADRELAKFQIIADIKSNKDSPFYINFAGYPADRKSLPVGVFDSGTGGLTVLNSILTLDQYNNKTGQTGKDGIPDFISEHFVYFGDKANMPYGRYNGEGKSDFLKELIIKDVRFLLGREYFQLPGESQARTDKKPVKTIVIACNTATAFGLHILRKAVKKWGVNIEVLGIISAGTRAAAASLPADGKDQTVGVMATEGTCASKGYPKSMKRQFQERFKHKDIAVVQQAGFGLAAAIDGNIDFIDRDAEEVRGSEIYHGPGLNHPVYPIDLTLWQAYHFKPGKGLLIRKDKDGKIIEVELNSVLNYIKYHVTHLVVKALREYPKRKLGTVILGCTHYPFFEKEIAEHFEYLKQLNEEYRQIIPGKITLIDPAASLARELYDCLSRNDLAADESEDKKESSFYISIPNLLLTENRLDKNGEFPYAYKYGRFINSGRQFVKIVPFSAQWIKAEVLNRIKNKMPEIYRMIIKEDQK